MAKSGLLEQLRIIIADMVDANGNIRVTPIGTTGKRNLSNNRIKLLVDIIKLIKDTEIISQETRLYLFNRYITIKGVNELLNSSEEKAGQPVSFNNTLSKIQYDRNRLERIFGLNIIVDILSKDIDLSIYERTVVEQYVKYSGKDGLRKNLILNIPKDCMNSELSEEEFNEFISIIAPYTKSQIKFIEENLGEAACGYFNYLLGMPSLIGEHKQRAERLKALLSNGDTDK